MVQVPLIGLGAPAPCTSACEAEQIAGSARDSRANAGQTSASGARSSLEARLWTIYSSCGALWTARDGFLQTVP